MKQGDKIEVTFYGELRNGVVQSIGQSGAIVWVLLSGSKLPRWFHADSIKLAALGV